MRLLDLFCGQGGAGEGYRRAGFEVTGVDLHPQPRHRGEFVQADALEYLHDHGHEYDVVHASPPCRDHSALASQYEPDGSGKLLHRTIDMLRERGGVWVVENVERAKMDTTVVLCGSMFGLHTEVQGRDVWLRRHRRFLSNVPIPAPAPDSCKGRLILGVYGTGGGGQMTRGVKATPSQAREVMGIDWMTRAGLSQAIPPAYTEHIGRHLMGALA